MYGGTATLVDDAGDGDPGKLNVVVENADAHVVNTVSQGWASLINGSGSATNVGSVDLQTTYLALDYTGASSPIADLTAMLASAYDGGAWDGPGIKSSSAPGTGDDRSVGIGDNASLGYSTFGSLAVNGDSALLRYTLAGDATLDGATDYDDLVKLAQNCNASGIDYWYQGDFNYDGAADFSDLAIMGQTYNTSLGGGGLIWGAI